MILELRFLLQETLTRRMRTLDLRGVGLNQENMASVYGSWGNMGWSRPKT